MANPHLTRYCIAMNYSPATLTQTSNWSTRPGLIPLTILVYVEEELVQVVVQG